MKFVLAASLLVVAACAAACGNSPTEPTPTVAAATSPVTETFSSLLAVKGAASRSVVIPVRGTVTVTLSATTPAGTVVGLGVGIPRANGTGCSLSSSLATGAGAAAQLVVEADAGSYCVQVYDVGTLTDQVGFTVSIVHP